MRDDDDIFRPFDKPEPPAKSWSPERNPQLSKPDRFNSYAVRPTSRVQRKRTARKPKRQHYQSRSWSRDVLSSHDFDHMNDRRVRYFAFGSNMDAIQMVRRCPSAKGGEFGSLSGYALKFCGFSKGWGGAVATIAEDDNGVVWGRVWEMSWADLKALDGFEGHPFVYRRSLMDLDDGSKAMVYVKPVADNLGAPSESYFKTIARGYQQVKLSLDKLVDSVRDTGLN